MDILPTALSAAGLALPSGLDGVSMLPVLRDNATAPARSLFWTNQGQLAARRGHWKLVINGKPFDRRPEGNQALTDDDAMFLSNVEEDPGETRNLRKLHPNLVDELATAVQRWHSSLPAVNP